ncbi:MAG: ROK family transcriptional regulator [Granulosicoccus sp.]|nr:ROK family transcriptional regulator [Granulosicoccus sp.]
MTNTTKDKRLAVTDPSGGANQARVRDHNQRLVLSLVRRHGSLPKSEIAIRTGLTAQTVTVIMRSLETEKLLLRGEPKRGKVGQPSIPMSLNPEGVFSIGLRIGRRGADLVLVDFLGQPLKILRKSFAYPTTSVVRTFARTSLTKLLNSLTASERKRVAGIGVSVPYELWNWAEKVGAPEKKMNEWKAFNFQKELAEFTDLPVFIQNDATAACGAELVFGGGTELSDFVYFYIGTFIGGGIVLNHTIYPGRFGNAGALGSMPVLGRNGNFSQLIDNASLIELENQLRSKNIDPSPLWLTPDDWSGFSNTLDQWVSVTAAHLAAAIVCSCSVIDFEAAVIDGALPEPVKNKLVMTCAKELKKMDLQGLIPPDIFAGKVGRDARVLGGASLPLSARYLLDQNVLIKEQA